MNALTMKLFPPGRLRPTVLALALLAVASLAHAQAPGPVPPEAIAAAALNPRLAAGESWIVAKTTRLKSLTLAAGAAVSAPAGQSLSMTVDGVETTLRPGRYQGDIVLHVAQQHRVPFSPLQVHPFRQALFLDGQGLVAAKSVTSAAGPFELKGKLLRGAQIRSKGENFNGLMVTGGHYTVQDLQLDFEGNGGNDFAGYGAGVLSTGKGTRLTLDGARIRTHGAVRTAVICGGGSHLLVRNSEIQALTGQLPPDYVSNVTPGEMKDAPWMLGIQGNVRATNVLGDNTVCTYLDSRLSADGWGVLSVDASQNAQLTAINSEVTLNGPSGYGSYAIGNSTNRFYGSRITAPTHGVIITDGHAEFGASTPSNLARLNQQLRLGLSPAELNSISPAQTVVRSGRHAVMMWNDATVKVTDATVFDTGEAVFLNKGAKVKVEVDGSGGAQLKSANGVIFQAMDNDDPGPVMVDGLMANTGVYHEPTEPPVKVAGFDLAAEHPTDMVARFSQIQLQGDFYNAIRQRTILGPFGPNGPSSEPPVITGGNLVLTLERSELQGRISSSTARHAQAEIGPRDWAQLGRVSNTPAPAINNGVIVSLQQSRWTVTGPSYLNRLDIGTGTQLQAPAGQRLVMTVNGTPTAIQPGRYQGQILLQPVPL